MSEAVTFFNRENLERTSNVHTLERQSSVLRAWDRCNVDEMSKLLDDFAYAGLKMLVNHWRIILFITRNASYNSA